MLTGIISKLYKIQGTKTINAITIGKRIVQLKDIYWSYLIRGKDALTQINVNTIRQVLIPTLKP